MGKLWKDPAFLMGKLWKDPAFYRCVKINDFDWAMASMSQTVANHYCH